MSFVIAFLDTTRHAFQDNVRENDYRIWNERVLPSSEGQLVPLPRPLIRRFRELEFQNIVRDMGYGVEEARPFSTTSLKWTGRRPLVSFGTIMVRTPFPQFRNTA